MASQSVFSALIQLSSHLQDTLWYQLAFAAILSLVYVVSCRFRKQHRSRRITTTPLISVVVDKPPTGYSHGCQTLSHERSGSLVRRTKSVSSTASEPSTTAEITFPTTLQDIPLQVKIKTLVDYIELQGGSSDRFVFFTQQSDRLARLTAQQLDEFWVDLHFEILRRSGQSPVHQTLALCASVIDSRREAIRKMSLIDPSTFLEMVQDSKFELERRQREASLPQRPAVLPPAILTRQDIDWKGHNPSNFGSLLRETSAVRVERSSNTRHFDVFCFDKIWIAFKPGITPSLKGRVFINSISELRGWSQDNLFKLQMVWGADDASKSTLLFNDRQAWLDWSNTLRDTVLRSKLQSQH